MLGIQLISVTDRAAPDPSGLWLDLDAELTLNFQNPIFDPQSIDRAWSYPFKLKTTPHNRRLLGFVDRLDVARLPAALPARLHLADAPFPAGVLRISGATEEEISCVLQSESVYLQEQLEAVNLRSTTELIDVAGPLQATFTFQIDLTEDEYLGGDGEIYAIRVNGRDFHQPIDTDLSPIADAINALWPGLVTWEWDESRLEEMPIPKYVFYLTFDHAVIDTLQIDERPLIEGLAPNDLIYFHIYDSTLGAEATRILGEYQTLLDAGGTDLVRFPVVRTPNLYGDKNVDYNFIGGYVNYITPDGTHPADDIGSIVDAENGWRHTLLPLITLGSRIDWLETLGFPVRLDIIEAAETELRDALLWNNRPADLLLAKEYVTPANEPRSPYRTYPPMLAVADCLPDLSAWDLLRHLADTLLLYFTARSNYLYLRPIADVLRTTTEDWTHLAEPTYNADYAPGAGYTLDYDRQSDETKVPGQLERQDGGPRATEYTIPFFPLHEKNISRPEEPNPLSRTWRVPFSAEEGESEYFGLSNSPMLRLLFYRGFQPDSEGSLYPLAGHSRQRYDGATVGAYSLDWTGPGGLYDAWWKEYIRLMQHGRTVRRLVRLTVPDLLRLITWRNPRKVIYSEAGTMVGVVKSVKIKASLRGISVAEVEFQIE